MAARKNGPTTKSAGRELVITRIFDAPRELVWKAWTEPERSGIMSEMAEAGWKESLDKLDESLGKEKSI